MKKSLLVLLITTLCLFLCLSFVPENKTDVKENYTKEFIQYLNTQDKSSYGEVVPLMYEPEPYNISTYGLTHEDYYCLRDEYLIYTTDQDSFGLCWAYACNTSLETYIAINYNEFYNFSSAWAGLTTKLYWDNHDYPGTDEYLLGGGGNMVYYRNAVQNYGLMLQSDFDLTDLYYADNNNYLEIYNNHSSKALNSLDFDFKFVQYTNIKDKKDAIKQHIKTNGSLYAGIYNDIVNETSLLITDSSKESNHAVSIIGWDDNYKANGWSNSGAWIALNSWGDDWGNDGIFYISYDDVIANSYMGGVVHSEANSISKLVLTDSSSNIENHLVNKYTKSKPTQSSVVNSQFNIFEEGKEIRLEYSYLPSLQPKNIQVYARTQDKMVNDELEISFTENKIIISSSTLTSGTYKLDFALTLQDDSVLNFEKAFTIINGLEYGCITYLSDATTQTNTTNQVGSYYTNFNSFNKKLNSFEIYSNRLTYVTVYLPTYSKISSYSCQTDNGLNTNLNINHFTKATESSYSEGYLYFVFVVKDNMASAPYNASIILGDSEGKQSVVKFKIYPYYDTSKITYINTFYNGTTDRDVQYTAALNSSQKKYIPSVTRGTSSFEGWYTSPNFEESSMLSKDETGYYFTQENLISSTGKNYQLNNYSNTAMKFYYINIYAKWSNSTFSVTYEITTDTLGNKDINSIDVTAWQSHTIYLSDLSLAIPENIEGYKFLWSSGNTNVSIAQDGTATISNINQNVKIIGSFVPNPPIISKELITVISKVNQNEHTSETIEGQTISVAYNPVKKYKLSIFSNLAENLELSYTWKKENKNGLFVRVSNDENLMIENASESGNYICSIVAKNTKLNKESIESVSEVFSIQIKKAQTLIDTSAIIKDIYYNGQTHKIEGASINHNEGQIIYFNNIVRNVNDGTIQVQISVPESNNYLSATEYVDVRLHKAKITIKIENKRSGVFAERQAYTYQVKHGQLYEGDDLELEYISKISTFFAGSYKISAIAHNNNYEVEILDGTYVVYLEGFSLALLIIGIAVTVALSVLLTYFIIKKKNNDKVINAKDFDDNFEIRD